MKYTDLKEGEIYKAWFQPDCFWIFKFKKRGRGKSLNSPGVYWSKSGEWDKPLKSCNLYELWDSSWSFGHATLEEKNILEPQNENYEIY